MTKAMLEYAKTNIEVIIPVTITVFNKPITYLILLLL